MSFVHPWTQAAFERGKSTWPEVSLDPSCFLARVRALAADESLSGGPADEHAADLYLACACAQGDPSAVQALERAYLSDLSAALRRLGLSADAVDDVLARLLEELVVRRDDRAPKIEQYAARSSLKAWLGVVATRMALRHARRDRRKTVLEERAAVASTPVLDPELCYFKERYRALFNRAFQRAVNDLTARERNLLRYQYCERMTGDELAALYGVHRATAVRWLTAAREALSQGTRRHFAAEVSLGPRDTDSVLRLVQSQLDFSIGDLFAGEPDPTP